MHTYIQNIIHTYIQVIFVPFYTFCTPRYHVHYYIHSICIATNILNKIFRNNTVTNSSNGINILVLMTFSVAMQIVHLEDCAKESG